MVQGMINSMMQCMMNGVMPNMQEVMGAMHNMGAMAAQMGGGGGFGGKGGKGFNKGGEPIGEVRFNNPEHAQAALQMLNGTQLNGSTISIAADFNSQDGTKLRITGIAPGTPW